MQDQQQMPPHLVLMKMATGCWASSCLTTFAELKIADHLKDETHTLKQLAEATHANEDFLFRYLRATAALGLVEQVSFDAAAPTFKATDLGKLVRADAPGSVRNAILMLGGRPHQLPWLDLTYAVVNGTEAFTKNFGKDVWQFTSDENPEWLKIFNGAMSDFSRVRNNSLIEAYDFTGISKLVDVGGGQGVLLASILARYPSLQGVVFDRPSVVAAEAEYPKPDDVRKRLEFVGGDFFESVPAGADAYLLSAVIHDWGDADSERILKNVHKAMAPGGRLLLSEMVVPNDNSPHQSKLSDLNMMVMCPGGKERTEEQFARLFERAGFKLNRIVPTKGMHYVVEGFRV